MQRKLTPLFIMRFKAGYSDDIKAAELCGVTVQTIRRWDRHSVPKTVTTLYPPTKRLNRGWSNNFPSIYTGYN